MFPFWSKASEEQMAAAIASQHQVDGHEAAVQRIVEQAHVDDEILSPAPEFERAWRDGERAWDGPTAGPGSYGAGL
jgi:hypothetical protein